MKNLRIAMVGAGGISQVVRIPALKKMEGVDLVALCDIDEAKASFVADKFGIRKVYFDIEELLKNEKPDGVIISTPNNFHFPMALATLESGVPTLVERPIALNQKQAARLADKVKETGVHLIVGMNNRFREDAIILKDFLSKNELGQPFYVKTGWLRQWRMQPHQQWIFDKKISGGGVLMDMGIQLIDLSLWMLGNPAISNVRSFNYQLFNSGNVEDSALAIIETESKAVITVEVAWRLHLEKDMNYTHVFGKQGGAFMNPLRLYKELHGNLVNVTPVHPESSTDVFKSAFELEIYNFLEVIRGKAQPVTPVGDGLYLMRIIDALYLSAEQGKQIDFS
jgi:predicted dehydrogenase